MSQLPLQSFYAFVHELFSGIVRVSMPQQQLSRVSRAQGRQRG
jgi:hypothetical protein